MAKRDREIPASPIVGPLAIHDAPMEVGALDLGAWLPPAPHDASVPALATLAVELWRLRGRLEGLRNAVSEADTLALQAVVSAAEGVLRASGVTLDDPCGRPYEEGDAIEVVGAQTSTDISRPTVVRTIRPTIRVGRRVAQAAQVILATPARSPA